MRYWTLGKDKTWSTEPGGELDIAFEVFIRLKSEYGDQFQFIVEDLEQAGEPMADARETAQMAIKIIVEPADDEIDRELKDLGLICFEEEA